MRCFIAILLPCDIRRGLGDLVRRLAQGGQVKWVREDSFHLTLKFLGDVTPDRIPSLGAALKRGVAGLSPFNFRIRGVGAFPNTRRPRVIWAGVEGGAAGLEKAFDAVEATVTALGYPAESRRYSPHITLGRSKDSSGHPSLIAAMKREEDVDIGAVQATRIHLMESWLGPEGPRYIPLDGFDLCSSLG